MGNIVPKFYVSILAHSVRSRVTKKNRVVSETSVGKGNKVPDSFRVQKAHKNGNQIFPRAFREAMPIIASFEG